MQRWPTRRYSEWRYWKSYAVGGQATASDRIASGTGLSRDTVVRYITAAEALGVSRQGPEPSEVQISRLAVVGRPGPREVDRPTEDVLAPWADQIHRWLTGDRLQLTRIQELLAERGCRVSYALPAAVRGPAQLAQAQQGHRTHGGHPARRGGGGGLRPLGPDP